MLLFYIRHGDPIYDPDQLTPFGVEQAKALANRLALYGIDDIYSSTSNRAMQTAMPTCELLGKELKTLDFLNENYLGGLQLPGIVRKKEWVWSHPEFSETLSSREVRSLGDKWYTHPKLREYHFENVILPINQQIDYFIASYGYEHDTDKGLYKVTQRNAEKRVAVFAHECMGKIFMSHLLDVPFAYYAPHFEMHTSAFSAVRFDDGGFYEDKSNQQPYARARLLTLSNDSHLYRDGVSLNHRFTHLRETY